MAAHTLIMVRHGESAWNAENKFCGWYDADLADTGLEEAKCAGDKIKASGLKFDIAFTSVLKRAIKTLFFIQEQNDLHWVPVIRDWRLNERMYGSLQGLNKAETAAKHGEEQVQVHGKQKSRKGNFGGCVCFKQCLKGDEEPKKSESAAKHKPKKSETAAKHKEAKDEEGEGEEDEEGEEKEEGEKGEGEGEDEGEEEEGKEEEVEVWRRSYDVAPPPVDEKSPHWPGNDPKYKHLDKKLIPKTECLKDTVSRVIPYWNDTIVPEFKKGKVVLIAAHGNSIRAMCKHLDNISDADIMNLNIPTGMPLIYELDKQMKPLKHHYLATDEEVKQALAKVAAQGKAKPEAGAAAAKPAAAKGGKK